MNKSLHCLILLLTLALTACEVNNAPDDESAMSTAQPGRLTIELVEQDSFAYSHLCFAIYDQMGKRLRQTNQTPDDSKFGTASYKLDEGTYGLVILAHSSTRNPAMTNPDQIRFNNGIGYTETFLFYDTLHMTSVGRTLTPALQRVVAMCRFVISDPLPDEVAQLRCDFTGGSGHLSAVSGHGVTAHTQTATFSIDGQTSTPQFDLYTFLPHDADTIALTVTALDKNNKKLLTRDFSVPMQTNVVTWLAGRFFDTESTDSWTIIPNVTLSPLWSGEKYITY